RGRPSLRALYRPRLRHTPKWSGVALSITAAPGRLQPATRPNAELGLLRSTSRRGWSSPTGSASRPARTWGRENSAPPKLARTGRRLAVDRGQRTLTRGEVARAQDLDARVLLAVERRHRVGAAHPRRIVGAIEPQAQMELAGRLEDHVGAGDRRGRPGLGAAGHAP